MVTWKDTGALWGNLVTSIEYQFVPNLGLRWTSLDEDGMYVDT
jgi:hypothetical protein